MARKYRTTVREVKAVDISVEVKGLDAYKDAWLAICNNARDNTDTIYKVCNSYSNNNIHVLCNPEYADNIKSWLSQYGDIIQVDNDRYAVFVDVDCEYTVSFDDDYIDSVYVIGETD